MKRLFLYALIFSLIASPVLAGGYGYGYGPSDPSLVFDYTAKYHLPKDRTSGNAWVQTYAGTNRTRINSAGLLETVAANTPVIDHVGASLIPAIRVESAAVNILIGNPPETQDVTVGTGSYTLQVWGSGTAAVAEGTATITGAGTASSGTPVVFTVTAVGTATITITGAIYAKLETGSIPSSYFPGPSAAGSQLTQNAGFETDGAGGADVFANWSEIGGGTSVTEKDLVVFHGGAASAKLTRGDTTSYVYQNAIVAPGNVVTLSFWSYGDGTNPPRYSFRDVTNNANIIGITNLAAAASWTQTIVHAVAPAGCLVVQLRLYDTGVPAAACNYDDVSMIVTGTSRASEAGTLTIATPAGLAAALADEGTIVMKIRFPYAKTAVSAATGIITPTDSATGFIYHDATGVFTLADGTNTATNEESFSADTDYILAVRWGKTGDKMDIGFGPPGVVIFGDEADFDGAFATTGDITYLLHTIGQGGAHIYWIKAYKTILDNSDLNSA